ncbi:hypothetical protein GMD78_10900 [Ornithinibacillus sp. L9]|uniref:Uncharacterized protein n=1 Tax=Ornithinibacillus caprae TaxID=2678566 RepID=A0A6N8FI44_9BACI|nr:hypothetical protein [Ornithinibacillus caprae]MUK88901.1 hypothetical protein [Ornithinibacillus caprae]
MLNALRTRLLDRLKFLKIPELDVSGDSITEFESLYEQYVSSGNGELIPYDLPDPKYIFLNYLIENKNIVVHGSNNPNINIFEPRDQTLFNGKKVTAVFAASDSIWSMFFAVINRSQYEGSLRNACLTADTKKGVKRYYYFSLNKDYHGKRWTNGMIYLFDKDGFQQGGAKNEWISEKEVKPIAKIPVEPSDFIFKDSIKLHDEATSHVKNMMRDLTRKR